MNLEQTAVSILEQFPDGQRHDLSAQERRLEKFGNIAFGGFILVIGIAVCWIIYLILQKMILSGQQPLPGILLIAFIVFALLSLGYVVWNEALKEKRQKFKTAPGLDSTIPTSKLLEQTRFEPASSIIDDTTELLHIERKTKDLDRSDV